jgi:wyosine [tRNA(Phe)-imidazoG37] synthetase (radical SAM superfamily)
MAGQYKYLYGPVPSRRLGRSLGLDIIPAPRVKDAKKPSKICTLDCVYCQLGTTSQKTIERIDYAPLPDVLAELQNAVARGLNADFIAIAGSGEPTLHSRLGELIDGIRQITNIPIAILTNGTLLYKDDVRRDCAKADVVVPSLDAADEQTFRRVNRPHEDISINKLISGLCAFRKQFPGQIWLEVFVVEGMNTAPQQIEKIRNAIKKIRPDRIQLNTAVRPTAVAGLKKLDTKNLQTIAAQLSPKAEIIADFAPQPGADHLESALENLLSMLKRRPCSLSDISSALHITRDRASELIAQLQRQGLVHPQEKDGITFFKTE